MQKPLVNLVVLFTLLACMVFPRANAQNIDLDILKGINPRNPNSQYWVQTSASGYWVPAAISFGTLAYSLVKKDRAAKTKACELFISVGGAIIFTEILKPIINRSRPADAYPTEVFTNSATHGGSFPSGHTTLAFSTATTLALQYKKWYVVVPAYLWAAFVGYSRMYLGKHYPSDVFAGAAIGIGGAYMSHWLTKKLFR